MSDIVELNEATPALVRSRVLAYVELIRPRILGMVLFATVLGFYLALPSAAGRQILPLLVHTLLGTALVVAGGNALNQFLEARFDGQMARTRNRPVPSGRLSGPEALTFAVVVSVAGLCHLALLANPLASLVAGVALSNYVLIYTPLKRRTPRAVFIGAVSGALPPVIGWSAAAGSLTTGAWLPFAILFFWQLPHFAAIAWLHREDYRRAGFPMLPVIDRCGVRTVRHVLTHSLALLGVSLVPTIYGMTGVVYALGAMTLGLAFLTCGVLFVYRRTKEAARFHLLASVVYLPLLFAFMMIDKAPS